MKTSLKIVIKLLAIGCFLWITPFFSTIREKLAQDSFVSSLVYHQKTIDEKISIKDQLNVLSYNSNLNIKKEDIKSTTTSENESNIPQTPTPENANKKRIYIYNTHQSEGYAGGETVMDGAAILGNKLKEKGFDVILETNDFNAYGKQNGLDYNSSYKISNKFINDALANYGGFDLIIDLHRDAIPREASYTVIGDKSYAKMMMVVGGLGKNAYEVTKMSSTLTDIINRLQSGIMRTMMVREAYYNQEMSANMVLIECGGDVNTFEEVSNSLDILSQGIAELLAG